MSYSNDDLARIAQQHGAKLIAVTGPDIVDDDAVDVTDVRTRLYHGGVEYMRRRSPYSKVVSGKAEPGDPRAASFDAYEGYLAAGTFEIALATILRYLQQESPEHAQIVARIADEVMECGIDALGDTNDDLPYPTDSTSAPAVANDDLDEQARTAVAE